VSPREWSGEGGGVRVREDGDADDDEWKCEIDDDCNDDAGSDVEWSGGVIVVWE